MPSPGGVASKNLSKGYLPVNRYLICVRACPNCSNSILKKSMDDWIDANVWIYHLCRWTFDMRRLVTDVYNYVSESIIFFRW